MSASYRPIGTDCAVVVECVNGDWQGPVRMRTHKTLEFSRILRTEEIGDLSAYLALIYSERTGKMPMFPTKTPVNVETFDVRPVQVDDFDFDLEEDEV